MKEKIKKPAISKVFAKSQFIGAILLVLLIIANSFFLYWKEWNSALSQRETRVQLACSETNARIREIQDTVSEILIAISNEYDGLRSGPSQQKTIDKLSLNRYISNKRSILSELDNVYVIKPGDFIIFQSSESIFPKITIKDYLENNCHEVTTSSSLWKLIRLEENSYFVRCTYYRDADIYVGVAIRAETILQDLISISKDSSMKFEIQDEFGTLYQVGDMEEDRLLRSYYGETELLGTMKLRYTFSLDFLELMQRDFAFMISLVVLISLAMYGYTNNLVKSKIIRPVQGISQSVKNIGDLTELRKIPENAPVEEIYELEKTVNTLLEDAVYSRLQLYQSEIQKKGQELRLLRSQLRPHFFLNAITTVSTMTYEEAEESGENIRKYLIEISSFMRYILASEDSMSTLEEEISCLENYLQIQETRYPGKLLWFCEIPDEIKQIRIPRFLLLTIGENAVKYGMRSEDILQVFIQCSKEQSFVLISVEDNGPGFSQEQIDYYNSEKLPEPSEDHIGLSNIKRSLSLQYKRDDLMKVSTAIPEGARVEIRIPIEMEL